MVGRCDIAVIEVRDSRRDAAGVVVREDPIQWDLDSGGQVVFCWPSRERRTHLHVQVTETIGVPCLGEDRVWVDRVVQIAREQHGFPDTGHPIEGVDSLDGLFDSR